MKPERCIDCPAHRIEADPDPHDSFCRDDAAVTCGFKPWSEGDRTSQMDRPFNFKPISTADRPYHLKRAVPPAWCPLPNKPNEAPNAD